MNAIKTHLSAWKPAFLAALAIDPNVTAAARDAGISRQAAYAAREGDREFADAWEDAIDQAVDSMESEARRRAMQGTEKPVFYQGEECGRVREYSDQLIMFLLRAHRPEKYRENVKLDHSGSITTIRVEYQDHEPDYLLQPKQPVPMLTQEMGDDE